MPIHTYNDGTPYRNARGRAAQRGSVEQHVFRGHPIVRGFPTSGQFLKVIKRELKIRGYSRSTISNYISYLTSFLRWFGSYPHRVTIEDVRNYLEMLVDGGASSAGLAGNLAALRTAFDKF